MAAQYMQRQRQFEEITRRRNMAMTSEDIREAFQKNAGPNWSCFSGIRSDTDEHCRSQAQRSPKLNFYVCLACWKNPTDQDFGSGSFSFGFSKCLCADCADNVISVDHEWDHPFLYIHNRTNMRGEGLQKLRFEDLRNLIQTHGQALRGVERTHDSVCKKCSRKIRGARYTRPYHFVPASDLSENELDLDPYWILIPSLFPNDDFEDGELVKELPREELSDSPYVASPDIPVNLTDGSPDSLGLSPYSSSPPNSYSNYNSNSNPSSYTNYKSVEDIEETVYTSEGTFDSGAIYSTLPSDEPPTQTVSAYSSYRSEPETPLRKLSPAESSSATDPYSSLEISRPSELIPSSSNSGVTYAPYDENSDLGSQQVYTSLEAIDPSPKDPATSNSLGSQQVYTSLEAMDTNSSGFASNLKANDSATSNSIGSQQIYTSFEAMDTKGNSVLPNPNPKDPADTYSSDPIVTSYTSDLKLPLSYSDPNQVPTNYTLLDSNPDQVSAPNISSNPLSNHSTTLSESQGETLISPRDQPNLNRVPSRKAINLAKSDHIVLTKGVTIKSRNWNEDFQSVFDSRPPKDTPISDQLRFALELSFITNEFISTAQTIGKIIIDEVRLPVGEKLIKPANVGGVAGGEKYIVEGIFFKFAIDSFGVYGGDDFAMKAAGHELHGLKAYHTLSKDLSAPEGHVLHFPFMALISYKGMRLIATPKLPLSSSSLIYGSNDAGRTVFNSDPIMNGLMKQAGEKLHISAHVCGLSELGQGVLLDGPTDVEGHKGNDGRYYLLDTARICPPEPPRKAFIALKIDEDSFFTNPNDNRTGRAEGPMTIELMTSMWKRQVTTILESHEKLKDLKVNVMTAESMEGTVFFLEQTPIVRETFSSNSRASALVGSLVHCTAVLVMRGRKGSFLYNLFRYEALDAYNAETGKSLSSDAFTHFGRHNSASHNQEVFDAFFWLLGKRMNEFVEKEVFHSERCLLPSELVHTFHKWGFNLRLLGFFRSLTTVTAETLDLLRRGNVAIARSSALTIMIARAIKTYMRNKLRTISDDKVIKSCLNYLNIIFGRSRAASFFWHLLIKIQLSAKYDIYGPSFLSSDENKPNYDLRNSVSLYTLFNSVKNDLGLIFSEEGLERFQSSPSTFGLQTFVFRESDIKGFAIQSRHLLDGVLLSDQEDLMRKALYDLEMSRTLTAVVGMSEADIIHRLLNGNSIHVAHFYISRAYSASRSREVKDWNSILSDSDRALAVFSSDLTSCPLEVGLKALLIRAKSLEAAGEFDRASLLHLVIYKALTTQFLGIDDPFKTTWNSNAWFFNARPTFLLVLLDSWVNLLLKTENHILTWSLGFAFISVYARTPCPGNLLDIGSCFDLDGPYLPLVLSLGYIRYMADHFETYRPFENILMQNYVKGEPHPTLKAYSAQERETLKSQVKKWTDGAHWSDLSTYSGVCLSPLVLDRMLHEESLLPFQNLPMSSYHVDLGIQVEHGPFLEKQIYRINGKAGRISVKASFRPEYQESYSLVITEHTDPKKWVSSTGRDPREVTYQTPFAPAVANDLISLTSSPFDVTPGIYRTIALPETDKFLRKAQGESIFVLGPGQDDYVLTYRTNSRWVHIRPELLGKKIKHLSMSGQMRYHHIINYDFSPYTLLVVDEDFRVFDFGLNDQLEKYITNSRNLYHEKSRELTGRDRLFELKDMALHKFTQISCSYTHCAAVTSSQEGVINDHGALGHGDHNPRLRPRLIEKLKGTQIERVICGTSLTYIIDTQGQVSVCGRGFQAFPNRIDFFSQKKIRILDISIAHDRHVGSFEPVPFNPHDSDLPPNLVFFLSDIGEVYWTSPKSPIPKLFLPASEHFVVEIAFTELSASFLTSEGEVYSCGRWVGGECGNVPLNESGALSEKDSDGLPLKLYRVWLPSNPKIVSICTAADSSIALDEKGQVWNYGEYVFHGNIGGVFTPYRLPHMHEHVVYKVAIANDGFAAACGRVPSPLSVPIERLQKREEVRAQRAQPNLPSLPAISTKWSDWSDLLSSCEDLTPATRKDLETLFESKSIPILKLIHFDFGFLTNLGIIDPNHQLALMAKVNELKKEEQRQMIEVEFRKLLGDNQGFFPLLVSAVSKALH